MCRRLVRWRDERGQILPLVAILGLAMVLVTGLVLMAGTGFVYGELLQQVADAASLAAASEAEPVLWYWKPVVQRDRKGRRVVVDPHGSCTLRGAPSDLPGADRDPCRVEVVLDRQKAYAAAVDALRKNAQANSFSQRGIRSVTITGFDTSVQGGRRNASAYLTVSARVHIPLMELFGSSERVMTRTAKSRVEVCLPGASC